MKRIFSLLLAALMLVSALPVAYATNTYDQGTQVEYIGTATEAYTITVPALLAPGASGTVTLEGTWASDRIVTVTADPSVVLTNSINAADQKTLAVNFAGISEAGSNTGSQTFTETVSVADIQDAIFGTWSGKFNYNAEIADAPIPVVGSATFSKYFTSPGCHNSVYAHSDSCYTIEQNTLTWEELELEENGTIYGYNAAAITDTGIGEDAFYNCRTLTNVTIPESVTSIGVSAFHGCQNLTNTTIPDSVTSIGAYAFTSCFSLTNVTIPDSVTSIGREAFYGCTGLTSISVDINNPTYSSIDGVLYSEDMTILITYPAAKGDETFTIPASVTSIGLEAFSSCDDLTSIDIPDGVTSIEQGAFQGCIGLTSIDIPDSVTSIGNNAFFACQGLTSVTIGDGVSSIEHGAFRTCTSLTTINFTGTTAQWNAITLDEYWVDYNTPATEVICSDGTVALS